MYYTEGHLFIVAEDAAAGNDVNCLGVPGTLAQVLVTGSCAIGDPLIVSSTAGVAEAMPDGEATVGIAMEAKASENVALVTALLVENKGVKVNNASNASQIAGTVYAMSSGGSSLVPNAIPAKKGRRPIGLQANSQSQAGTATLLHAKPGERGVAIADTNEVRIGDWLVPSSSVAGQVRNGNGYGIGYALSAKAQGTIGKVVVRLYPAMYGYSPRAWWLPDGITEDQVIAAYQFVDRESEADALININEGTAYGLAKVNNTELWNRETGFYIPGEAGAGLDNSQLRQMYKDLSCAVFGYSGAIVTGSHAIGGVIWTYRRALELRGFGTGTVYQRSTINQNNGGVVQTYVSPTIQTSGILGGNWLSTSEMYKDGEQVTLASGTSYNTNHNRTAVIGQVGTSGSSFDISPFYVTAVVFYNTALTASQHAELAENIRNLGGI